MTYTIQAVSPETRAYESKYGAMVSYKVMFEGNPQAVEISQKQTTPAPKVGDTLDGTIDMSGQYGPKFKKEYNQGVGGFPSGSPSPMGARPSSTKFTPQDQFTMYLSYSKDIVVALINSGAKLDHETAIQMALGGGHALYDGRPGAEPKVEAVPDKLADMPVEMPADFGVKTVLDDIFDAPIGETPWPKS